MSSPKNYGLSDSLISKVTAICEMSSNRARDYLRASTAQARELQGKIYTPDATEVDKRKYKNRSKYFSKALKRSRSIGEDEDMTAEKNYGLSDDLIETARAVLTKSSETLDEARGYKAHELDAAGYKHVNHVNSGQTSTTMYRHPDGHEIHVERGNNSKKYSFYSGKPGASSQVYHANLKDAIKKNGHLVEETLDESWGNPKRARRMSTGPIRNHPHEGRQVRIDGGDHAGKTGTVDYVEREHTFSSMVPYKTTHHVKVDGVKGTVPVRIGGNATLIKKTVKEETLDEGRGRPRKTPLAAGEEEGNEPDQNIIMQLRKVQSLRGAKPVSFRDGTKHTVHMADALKAIRMHSMMRTSIEKGNFEAKIAKSHADFKHHIGSTIKSGGSEEEKKAKVTLPGVDRLRAKGKLEEGIKINWRPNQEVSFKHTDGKWHPGRIESHEVYGHVSGTGATKHNPNDHSVKAWGHTVSYDMGDGKRGRYHVPTKNIMIAPAIKEEQIDELKRDFKRFSNGGESARDLITRTKSDSTTTLRGYHDHYDNQKPRKKTGAADHHRLVDKELKRRAASGYPNGKLTKSPVMNAEDTQLEEANLDDVWKNSGNNSRMRLIAKNKPKAFSVDQHNERVDAKKLQDRAKKNVSEEQIIDEAKPDFHYQEWPGKKPKKAFNLSKYLENSDKRTKAREKLNDDAKNKKGFFKEEEQIDELSIDTMYRYKNKAGAEYHRLNNYGGPRGTGMNRRHSNRQNGIDLANERIHAGPRTKPGLRLAKLQGKVHPNAKDEDFK